MPEPENDCPLTLIYCVDGARKQHKGDDANGDDDALEAVFTDVSNDSNAKYWLYFRIRGFKKDRPIRFLLKNANHLRKYYGQTRYKPYMMFREG